MTGKLQPTPDSTRDKIYSRIQQVRRIRRENDLSTVINRAVGVLSEATVLGIAQRISERNDLLADSNTLKENYQYWKLPDNIEHLYPALADEQRPLQDVDGLRYNLKYYSFKHPFVAEVPDVTITGPCALAITDTGQLVTDTIDFDPHNEREHSARMLTAVRESLSYDPVSFVRSFGDIKRENYPKYDNISILTLMSGPLGYVNSFVDSLARLRGVSYYEDKTGQDVTLIIPPNSPQYFWDGLDRLGYADHDCIEWDSGIIRANTLVVPSYPEITPHTLQWLRNEMQSTIETDETESGWYYISRQQADRRRLVNYDEVETILKRYGVRPVICEELSLEEQIRLFSNADGIIGVHGSGMGNMIWADETHVVELFSDVIKAPFYLMAYVLNHDYTAIAGRRKGNATYPMNEDIAIDTDEFEETVKTLTEQTG